MRNHRMIWSICSGVDSCRIYVAEAGDSTKACALWAWEMGIVLHSRFATLVEEEMVVSFIDDGGTERVDIRELPTDSTQNPS